MNEPEAVVPAPAFPGVAFLPTLRRQSLLMTALAALFGTLMTASLWDALEEARGTPWLATGLGCVIACVVVLTFWLVNKLLRQSLSQQPVLTLGPAGLASPQLRQPIAWHALRDVSLDRHQHGGVLRFVLQPDPSRPDRPRFLDGQNAARPSISLHMLTPEQQLDAFASIHARLTPLRVQAGLGEADSLVLARAAAAFEDELDRLTPHTWALYAMLLVNIGVWVAQVASGLGAFAPSTVALYRWGANTAASVLVDGDYWRLLTGPFLHAGLSHLGFNMLALWAAGRQLSRLLGNAQFLLVYTLSALCGSAASLHFAAQDAVSVGASGAVFGVLGALLASSWQYRHRLPVQDRRRLWSGLGVFVVYSLVHGLTQANVDNAAHFGGLAGGLWLGLMLKGRFDMAASTGQRAAHAGLGAAVSGLAVLAGVMTTPIPRAWPGQLYEGQAVLQVATPQFMQVFRGLEAAGQRRQQGQISRAEFLAYAENVAVPQCRRISAALQRLRAPLWEPLAQGALLYRHMCDVMVESITLEVRKARDGAKTPAEVDARLKALGAEMSLLVRRMASLPKSPPRTEPGP